MKSKLTASIAELLRSDGFEIVDCTGSRSSFDLIAKNDDMLFLIKILKNIEGFNRTSAQELKNVSSLLSGIPIIIGETMKNSLLSDDIVYDRYGIIVANQDTFGKILKNIFPNIYSTRGNYCVRIDSNLLTKLRHKADLTQDMLAKMLKVSKQSIYRYEKEGRVSLDVFERLLELFEDEGLALPGFEMEYKTQEMKSSDPGTRHLTELKKVVVDEFTGMGFNTSLTNAPFDIYASSEEKILTVVSNDWRRLKNRICMMKNITSLVGGYSMCVSERHIDAEVSVFKPSELHEIDTPRDFFKLLSE